MIFWQNFTQNFLALSTCYFQCSCEVLDAEITDIGPKILDVKLPPTPFTEIDKISFEEFSNSDFMRRITRDVNKDNWPQWVATLLNEGDHSHVYPMVIQENFPIFNFFNKDNYLQKTINRFFSKFSKYIFWALIYSVQS